jgi:hypothetical protein
MVEADFADRVRATGKDVQRDEALTGNCERCRLKLWYLQLRPDPQTGHAGFANPSRSISSLAHSMIIPASIVAMLAGVN